MIILICFFILFSAFGFLCGIEEGEVNTSIISLFFLVLFIFCLFAEVLSWEKTPETLPKTGEINPFSLNNNANNLR